MTILLGIDENGLGPRLGPLVATAVALDGGAAPSDDASFYDAAAWMALGAQAGVGDSKATAGFGAMRVAEGLALAMAERTAGAVPGDADALFDAVGLEASEALQRPCDVGSRPQCWGASMALPAFGGTVEEGRARLSRLDAGGARIVGARSAVSCVRVYNREVARRGSKLAVDLELFERLMLDASGRHGRPMLALCGMVGGIRRYRPQLARLDPDLVETLEEGRRRSAYRVRGLGEMRFEVDSDAHHLPVALASMLGKYVREVWMERQTRFYRSHDATLPVASGYHDPVTARFVEASLTTRRRLQIAEDCFERAR